MDSREAPGSPAGLTGRVTGVVVSYHSASDLPGCLSSLRAAGVDDVVVVDNASTDGSAALAADLGARVVALDRNVGFAAAVNRGVAEADTPFVVVSNPDVDVAADAVSTLVSTLDRQPDVALVGPRIVNLDGSIYPSVRRFPDLVTALGHATLGLVAPDNRFSRRYKMLDWDHATPAPVDWVAGTFFAMRRDVFHSVGGFDEAYFMYVEDVDFCWRLHKAGRLVAYEPAAVVTHTIGGSTERRAHRMIVEHHRSLYRFVAKTATGWHRLLLPLLAAGLVARTVAAWVQRWVRRKPHAAP